MPGRRCCPSARRRCLPAPARSLWPRSSAECAATTIVVSYTAAFGAVGAVDDPLIRTAHSSTARLDPGRGCGTVWSMSTLGSPLRRLTSARSEESRISAFWNYLGSFGDDFFSDDDDNGSD